MVDHTNYKVWEKSHRLVLDTYKPTRRFPSEERFDPVSQTNRAVLSVPANIVEGCGRKTQKELARFLHVSSGSAHESEHLLTVSNQLGFLEVGRSKILLHKLMK